MWLGSSAYIPLAKASHVANPKISGRGKLISPTGKLNKGRKEPVASWNQLILACNGQFFNFRNWSNWLLKHQYLEIGYDGNIYTMEVGKFCKSNFFPHPRASC